MKIEMRSFALACDRHVETASSIGKKSGSAPMSGHVKSKARWPLAGENGGEVVQEISLCKEFELR